MDMRSSFKSWNEREEGRSNRPWGHATRRSEKTISQGHGEKEHDDDSSSSLAIESEQDRRKLARRGLRIGRTSVGKGVFATKRIPFATCIGEIEGIIHDYTSWESRYSFDLEDGRQLEPKPPFRYVNHSCQPNCNFQVVDFRDVNSESSTPPDPRILLYASGEIWVGEELTIDYNWPLDFAIRCRCKAERCRGWIVDPAQLVNLSSGTD